ncbi:MAG: hypothetical protein K9H64_16645 [Bacteroidales bacterium]|nr:hypothetical protein [Bacteroidales bacterium]MCF8457602.1 hypothetical protein [Bacteroidales bacterium]
MKTASLYFILGILILFSGCKKEDSSDFSVSGNLIINGTPIKNATVDIDGLEQYKTTTNSEGYFIIEKVYVGAHELNTKRAYENGSFIQKSYDIELQSNLYFDSLLLPNPVLIESITLDSSSNVATISWNKSYSADFREYKLYSHSSSGLDETTGTLQHVTIDANDTSKSIQLENLSEVYFRVFVLNDYGQLGGSNIISVASINKNLIAGGGFDNSNDLNYWVLSGDIEIDNTNYHSGNGSVLLSSTIDTVNNVISGTVDRWPVTENEMSIGIDLETDRDYTISFWYRLSGFGNMMYPFNFYYYQNNQEKLNTTVYDYDWAGTWIPLSPFKVLEDTGWLYFSKTFNSDSDANAVFHITTQVDSVWVDGLEIKIVE